MARPRLSAAAVLVLAVVRVKTASIEYVYVTDMPAYSALEAVSENIQWLTYDACPEAVSALQSCVCTKNNNLASISSEISASVSYECGSTASEDQASAQSVLSAYCDPTKTFTFSTPTAVSVYITDIPEFEYLAPSLASCACKKNQNSLVVSQLINASAKYWCSEHKADVSSAQAMFAAYCAMNDGTTKFPVPSSPPGDMSYYITDLPHYSSLAPCAASALSYAVQGQTYSLCPGGPQALASCVCFKEGVTSDVFKSLTSSVKWYCSSTATEDVSSAVAVLNYYCSAAEAKVTPPGVSTSVKQSHPSRTGGPRQTGDNGATNGDKDEVGNSSGSDGSTQQDGDGESSESSDGPSTGVIIGAVVGVVAGLSLIGGIIFVVMRARRGQHDRLGTPTGPPVPLDNYGGKPELPSDSVARPFSPPSPSPSMLKTAGAARVDNVSPVSATTGSITSPPPPNAQAELSGQGAFFHCGRQTPQSIPDRPELYGQGAPATNRPELQAQGAMYPTIPPNTSELQGQGSPFHSANPHRPELAGQYNYPPQQPPYFQQHQHQQQQHYSPHQVPSPVPPPDPRRMQPGYQAYSPGTPVPGMYGQQQQQQQQPRPGVPSWQEGPVPGLYEMDGG
ncbi:hypothetical protein VTH06DRAFT_7900 [Thermothelomyces fergusii]